MSDPENRDSAAEDERRYVEGLVVRGEAVPEGTEPLPPDATHEIVEERDGVPSKVRRRRFSLSDDLDVPDQPEPPEPDTARRVDVVFFDLGDTLGVPELSPPPIHLIGFQIFDFTEPVLAELRDRGLRLGVISNTGDDDGTVVDGVLERAGIRDFFEPVLRIYSRDVGLRKDSPRIFLLAAERAGVQPSRTMFVGEDASERAFAEQAGCLTVPRPQLVVDAITN